MATLQSHRRKNRQRTGWAWANQPWVHARRLARGDAERMAAPAPNYPAERKPGAPVGRLLLELDGIDRVEIPLLAPWPTQYGKRPRCDQLAIADPVTGQVVLRAAGKSEILAYLRKLWPRAMSLDALSRLQQGYSAQDEADAAAC